MTVTPEQLIRDEILALQAYSVAPTRGQVKLDAMENPYPWPGALLDDWLQMLREAGPALNRYPDAGAVELKRQLRQTFQVPDGAGLILGNGSDELIQLSALALARPGAVLLAPEPSFVMYRMVASFAGLDFAPVPLSQDFSLDPDVLLRNLRQRQPALCFFAYPNNPTGNRFDPALLDEAIRSAPGLVIIDEAYCAYSEHSFLSDVLRYDNLLVMRTLSKIGLAGLRLGFLCGPQNWLSQLEKLRLPYNISTLTQLSAGFALRRYPQLSAQAERLKVLRRELRYRLNALPGITAYPSETNFLTLRCPPGRAQVLHRGLREHGLLVKCLHAETLPAASPVRDCLRVTIGSETENILFFRSLSSLL